MEIKLLDIEFAQVRPAVRYGVHHFSPAAAYRLGTVSLAFCGYARHMHTGERCAVAIVRRTGASSGTVGLIRSPIVQETLLRREWWSVGRGRTISGIVVYTVKLVMAGSRSGAGRRRDGVAG